MQHRFLVGLVIAQLLAACGDGDCTKETCGNGKSYESCVDGSDLVVRDSSGNEYSRCETDYESDGVKDKNDCALKHAQSKTDFCAASSSSGSNGSNNPSMMMSGGSSARTCAADATQGTCTCDVSTSAPRGTKVSQCTSAALANQPVRCTQYQGSICGCQAMGCDSSAGSSCYCGFSNSATPRTGTACTGFEWYCAKDDGSECHGGSGDFGSACGNGEHKVSSCTVTSVVGSKTTCE